MSEPRPERRPPEVEAWARRFGGVSLDVRGNDLLEGALRALAHALARPGRNREAAFALLAADALLTCASEDAAGVEDPDAALREILHRLQELDDS